MDADDIGKGYDQIADVWRSDKFDNRNGIEQHKRAMAFVKHKGRALDIGCGCNGRFIDLLQGNGFSVEGVDISERMITLARERNPEVTFYHVDICEWQFPGRYDFVTAWDSIWHLPLAEQEPVLKKILSGLNNAGVCIFTTGGVDSPEEKTDSVMGPLMYYSVPGIPRILEVIAESGCVCRHLEYDQYPELHLYIIAQRV